MAYSVSQNFKLPKATLESLTLSRKLFDMQLSDSQVERRLAFIAIKLLRACCILFLPVLWLTVPIGIKLSQWIPVQKGLTQGLRTVWSRVKYATFGHPRPELTTTGEFRSKQDQLEHGWEPLELGTPSGSILRDIIIVDNFYDDPDAVRKYAQGLDYKQFRRTWYSSSFIDSDTNEDKLGTRLATSAIRARLEEVVKRPCDMETWNLSGDGMNGAFHIKCEDFLPWACSSVHNHSGREEDIKSGWAGVVFLNPNTNAISKNGTSIWKDPKTQKCYNNELVFSLNLDDFEPTILLENVYNRLILFRSNMLHMGEQGFGHSRQSGRLFQTFFFNTL